MQQCLMVYDNSWKFSMTIYGILALLAYLIQNHWLLLAASVLMIFGAISVNYTLPYQFHFRVLRKLLKDTSGPIKKEPGESRFVYGLTGSLLLIGFLLLYFGIFVSFAWILILMMALLMLLAGLAGVCVASLMYAVFKKVFKR